MIALRWRGIDDVALEEIEPPALTETYDVKVRVAWAAVCTSDIHIAKGNFGHEFPRTLGHEVAGTVVETGTDVRALSPGDLVALQPTIFCGECASCKNDDWHLCPNRKFIGLHSDGGFAEEIVAPEPNWVKLPPGMSLRDACLAEPLACVLHAVEVMRATARSRLVIAGAGPSAFLFVQVLKSMGIKPEHMLVSGRRDERLKIIREAGVRAVDVRREDFDGAVREHFAGVGPDIFVDLTGDGELLAASLDQLVRKGTLFIYDYMGASIPFDFGRLQLREIRILTSTGCPGTMAKAVDLIASSRIALEPMITHECEGREALKAFRHAMKKDQSHVKSVIRFA